MVEAVDANMVASKMVIELVKNVLKVVAEVIVTRMVTATILEQIATQQEKITIPMLLSTALWEETQHIAFVSHRNHKMGQILLII